jgi:DNA-binding response OmpR family regulator
MHVQECPADLIDVLVADDDAPLRHALCFAFAQGGLACAGAADGRQALELARRHAPLCVFLDLVLPELDGLSVARRLRSDPRTRAAVIHCLTGHDDPATRVDATRAGFDGFLAKPADPAELVELVRRQVRRAVRDWACGLDKRQAEDLLDWLEAHGAAGELAVQADGRFAVRCPGFRVAQDEWGRVRLSRA